MSVEVPKMVSEAQVRSFVEEGYLIVPDLISDSEREELKADIVKLARGGYPCAALPPADADFSDQQVLEKILCIHQPHFVSDVMRKYALNPKICGVLRQITAAHLPHWDGISPRT